MISKIPEREPEPRRSPRDWEHLMAARLEKFLAPPFEPERTDIISGVGGAFDIRRADGHRFTVQVRYLGREFDDFKSMADTFARERAYAQRECAYRGHGPEWTLAHGDKGPTCDACGGEISPEFAKALRRGADQGMSRAEVAESTTIVADEPSPAVADARYRGLSADDVRKIVIEELARRA